MINSSDDFEYQIGMADRRLYPEKYEIPPSKKYKHKQKIFFNLGITCIITGVLVSIFDKQICDFIRQEHMKIKPGTLRYDMWVENIRPFTFDIYFFNWTNPEDIKNPKIKPKFVEVGPYRFIQRRLKKNIQYNDNGTTTFQQNRIWTYIGQPELTLEDPITTINAVAVTAGYKTRLKSFIVRAGISSVLNGVGAKIHVTKTARELILEGYEDKVLSIMSKVPFLPKKMAASLEKFGWFYGWNNSIEMNGIFNVDTGLDEAGKLKTWNYRKYYPTFPDSCGEIEGYFGDQFPMQIKKEDFGIFALDVCKDINFHYETETTHYGLPSYKYVVGEKFLDNGTKYPENVCFNNGEAVPSGVVNVSACWYHSPTFLSLPHFYQSDPMYLNAVEGLNPKKDDHEFFIAIEPNTGIVTEAVVRVQFNFLLQNYPGISLFKDAPKIQIPVLWFEQKTGIHSDHVLLIHLLVLTPVIQAIICAIVILLGFYLVFTVTFKAKQLPKRGYEQLKALIMRRQSNEMVLKV